MNNRENKNSIQDDLALLDKEEVKWNQETLDAIEESFEQLKHPELGAKSRKEFWEDLLDEDDT